ncbi:MAG: hypothetical protein ABSA74_03950 [Candidatus Staskawiczbacteria bacterium]|jgi:hypothetical protein
MADQNRKEEIIKAPEKKTSATEQAVHFDWEKEKKVEKKETSSDEKAISEELKREIELMSIDENLKKQAEQKANKIQFLADDDKLKELLKIAREKGVIFAIQVAKKMNEPYLLDVLHDILAKEGYYKNFIKK